MEKITQDFDHIIGTIVSHLADYYDNEEYRLYDEPFQKIKENYTCGNLRTLTISLVDIVNIHIEFDKLFYMEFTEKGKTITMKENKDLPLKDNNRHRDLAIMLASFNVICKMYAEQGTYYTNKFYADMCGLDIKTFNIFEQMVLRVFMDNMKLIV